MLCDAVKKFPTKFAMLLRSSQLNVVPFDTVEKFPVYIVFCDTVDSYQRGVCDTVGKFPTECLAILLGSS